MTLVPGRHYTISIDHAYIQIYPKFVRRHFDSVVVMCKGSYIAPSGRKSYIFSHRIANVHPSIIVVWTCVASSTTTEDDYYQWTSDIYEQRFTVKRDLTQIIQRVVKRFKELLARRKMFLLWVLSRNTGLSSDISHLVLKHYYTLKTT